jgi:hypothetical protein
MSEQRGILWIPRSLILLVFIFLLFLSIALTQHHERWGITLLINVNLGIIFVLFVISFLRAKISGILYFFYACIILACKFYIFGFSDSNDFYITFLVFIPIMVILISSILLYVLPEKPKDSMYDSINVSLRTLRKKKDHI